MRRVTIAFLPMPSGNQKMSDNKAVPHIKPAVDSRIAKTFYCAFAHNRSGVTSVEFSLIILPFLMFFGTVLEIGNLYCSSQMLQLAAERIGRPIRTNSRASGATLGALIGATLCGRNGGLLDGSFDCDKIRVDIRSPDDWSHADMSNNYGAMQKSTDAVAQPAPGRIAIVRVGYPLPQIFNFSLFPGATTDPNGKPVRMIAGVSAFRVEPQ